MKRDELIDAIRAQVDLDEEELPTATAVMFLREAFDRTAAGERRWPLYQSDWEYVVAADTGYVTYDPSLAEIATIQDADGKRLIFADHDLISSAVGFTSTRYFSVWGGKLYLWSPPLDDMTIYVSGYRKPNYDWLSNTALEVDLDERLHVALFHYGVALAYAQQEDPELETMYMRRWAAIVNEVKPNIMKAGSYRPVVMNGGLDQQAF